MKPFDRKGGISIHDFASFYDSMMKHHRWGVMGHDFAAKYIDCCADTRDGEIWSVTLRDISSYESFWDKIPDPWKVRVGTMINISIRDVMDDKFDGLKERLAYILTL